MFYTSFFRRYVLLLCFGSLFLAQMQAQFFLNGNAIAINDSCYQLTSATNWEVGSIWNGEKINLNESFEVLMEIYFGCKDADGADGIVFGLQPISTTIGVAGGAIGFGDVQPALGVEFDTYQNGELGDPSYDHIAIIRDGLLDHNLPQGALAGPIQASASSGNIEDCDYHPLRITWDAVTKTLEVYFDCALRLTYSGDIVNTIFGGDPLVYWGFTSATGGLNNVHEICFSYTTFLDQFTDKVVCPGGTVQLEANGGMQYNWTPSDGLSATNIPNPFVTPTQTTLYTLEVIDGCGVPFYDNVLVEVAGDPVFFDLGPDTTLCDGDQLILDVTTPTAVYEWSTGATTGEVLLDYPGLFAVTVTRTDTFCQAEDFINIDYRPRPLVDLGPDTSLCLGQEITFNAFFDEATILWQNGSTDSSLVVDQAGLYSVTLDHPCGLLTDKVMVDFEDCHQVYLPNIFSPNYDGINDAFYPQDDGDVEIIGRFMLLDRWGNLMFEQTDFQPNDSAMGWDGRWNGKIAQQGVYVWVMELVFRDGTNQTLSGDVQLIR